MCHSGHFNAIRQAADCVNTVVIGPNTDADILHYKGPTILNNEERMEILQAVKWGDEVVADVPYRPSLAGLDDVNCQYYIHGDDPLICDGVDIL